MKQKDVALVIVIVFISAIVSLFVSKIIFVPPKDRQQAVPVVQPISPDFPQPDSRYFNSSSFDPTQILNVGQSANTNPFSGTSQ